MPTVPTMVPSKVSLDAVDISVAFSGKKVADDIFIPNVYDFGGASRAI